MYPLIKFNVVQKAVKYYSRNLSNNEKKIIVKCLEMVKFPMGNNLLIFRDKYFKYGGGLDAKERGLIICGYKSTWLAELVVSFILENNKYVFKDVIYFGIYQDDSNSVMHGNGSNSNAASWLNRFNTGVKRTTISDNLQFTAGMWGGGNPLKASQYTRRTFPFLDTGMF